MSKLLEGSCKDKYFDDHCFNNYKRDVHSSVDMFMGIKCDLRSRPHTLVKEVKPIKFGDTVFDKICFKHFCHDKGFAPAGCSIMKVNLLTYDYEYFKKLKEEDNNKYIEEKNRIANEIVKNLYVAGQWLWTTGCFPSALVSGKWAVQRLCKDEKIKWTL